jgi:prepilin-type N-terminal cleavage/methylation domain-containing protein
MAGALPPNSAAKDICANAGNRRSSRSFVALPNTMNGTKPLPLGKKELMVSRNERGFSLIEMVVVVSISLIVMAITFISMQPTLNDSRLNEAYATVLMQTRNARQLAVEKRQQYVVCYGATTPTGAATPLGAPTVRSVQVYLWPLNTPLSSAVQISIKDMPFDVKFQALSGLPAGATPDGFGSGNVAIDFDQGIAGGVKDQIMFLPDGSARDTNGNYNNGVLYFARGTDLYSSRAITVFGASGRVRGWRLVSNSGVAKWIQQ